MIKWLKRLFCIHPAHYREFHIVEHLYAECNEVTTYFECFDCGFKYGDRRKISGTVVEVTEEQSRMLDVDWSMAVESRVVPTIHIHHKGE